MSYYVIIRGPLGIGKTTVAELLAQRLRATYISIDRILDDEGLWNSGELSEFLRANAHAVVRARASLESGTAVIFDGNFYWMAQIRELVRSLEYPHFAFTLRAPLSVCIERDSRRVPSHGSGAAREVYAKTARVEFGTIVDAAGGVEEVVDSILSHLPSPGFFGTVPS